MACDLWGEEQEVDDAVAGGNVLKGCVGSDTETLRPSVPGRGDRVQFSDLIWSKHRAWSRACPPWQVFLLVVG